MPEPKVFISYAREDQEVAERIYRDLSKSGVQVWIDSHSLLPGQNWKLEIEKAIQESNYFLALLSSNSLSKRGYVQKELRKALNVLDEFPDTEIFLIPVRLDNCEPSHPRLAHIHRVDLFPLYEDGFSKILKVLRLDRHEAERASVNTVSSNKLFLPAYTSFQKDLENLILQATNDFMSIRGDSSNSAANGDKSYNSKFSFEYSLYNMLWQRGDGRWRFHCWFCKDVGLQQAETVFIEKVQEIKSILSNEWKFEEKENPNMLYRKEFEAIKRYNTLRITMKVTAYDPINHSEVDFGLEQLVDKI